jgi:hypothetical protein
MYGIINFNKIKGMNKCRIQGVSDFNRMWDMAKTQERIINGINCENHWMD